MDSKTEIPDRTSAILGKGPDPLPELLKSARRLQQMGADVLIMPCNTAHYWHKQIGESVAVELLSMIGETAKFIAECGVKTVGIIATDGTVRSGIYQEACSEQGIQLKLPTSESQQLAMDFIYQGVKAGNDAYPLDGFLSVVDELENAGCETVILGCTELSAAYTIQHHSPYELSLCRPEHGHSLPRRPIRRRNRAAGCFGGHGSHDDARVSWRVARAELRAVRATAALPR